MSTSRLNGGGGVQAIPAGSRKIVQSVKEIVNCPEAEIYAALKECNMDPNEAVNRLMTQDPFCEVKSKREKKKKEGKETNEPRPRGGGNASSRGGRTGSDRYHSRESTNYHGKSPSYPKENGSNPRSSSTPGSFGINRSKVPQAPVLGESASSESKGSSWGTSEVAQPPSGYRSTWGGGHGQVSMADIVKMGRPQPGKPFSGPNASHQDFQSPPLSASHNDIKSSEEQNWPEHSSVQPRSTNDEWPSIEKPATVQTSSVSAYNAEPEQEQNPPFVQHSDEEEIRDADGEKSGESSSGNITEDGHLYEETSSFAPKHHAVEDVDATVSSVARNLQQLNVDTADERNLSSEEFAPSVVIPEHLQVQSADLSHLSFGSFGSAVNFSYSSGGVSPAPAKSHLDEAPVEDNVPPAELTRNSNYYAADDSLRHPSDGYRRSGTESGSYDPSTASKQEELKSDNVELSHGNQYPFPPANQGYAFDDAHHFNTNFPQTSSNLQNLAPLSNVMQSYNNTMPSTLSAGGVQQNREADLHYSPFPGTQSMPAKYANSASAIDSSAITMSEALKTAGISSTQPTPQSTINETSVATGPPPPQHLMHPYSQPTLPLGPFANIMGYPFLPQSYTYLPSAFQQAFAGNNAYHQSLASAAAAAALPQYKSNVSASSLPQSAGYGAFGNASNISGNYQMNPPSAPSGTNISYEELLSSQYKDNNHLVSLSQNENPAMWLHGHNSRTVPAIPASSYYNYPGQSQQPSGFRQGQQQQPSQNYGALGYANFYHSQAHDHQQQSNARDASLGGPQGQPKQSQIWQNNY